MISEGSLSDRNGLFCLIGLQTSFLLTMTNGSCTMNDVYYSSQCCDCYGFQWGVQGDSVKELPMHHYGCATTVVSTSEDFFQHCSF